MNWILLLPLILIGAAVAMKLFGGRRAISPEAARASLAEDRAVLVDVREAPEWKAGVAPNATLLPLSDLRGARTAWNPFLERNRSRKILLYCASGMRSGMVAATLRKEGFDAVNAGTIRDWR